MGCPHPNPSPVNGRGDQSKSSLMRAALDQPRAARITIVTCDTFEGKRLYY
jgi:hypothetical protein